MSFIAELKRRNVIRVAVAYLVVSWVVLQIADVVFPALKLPEWSITLVTVLLALGFVVALVFSWAFELTPEGLKKDDGGPANPHAHRKLDLITIGAVVVVVALIGYQQLGGSGGEQRAASDGNRGQTPISSEAAADQTDTGNRSLTPISQPSVAVLPFTNMSGNVENEYFSDGLADTLLHMLAQTPDLRVAARTSSFQFKGQQVDARDVGRQLNVATVLEGSVQRAGDRVRVIVQLIDTETGYHLLSETYDRQMEDIFAVQDEIAGLVASELLDSLLVDDAAPSDVGGTNSVAAYEAFMQAAQRMERRTTEDVEAAIELLELATELDPDYGRAWAKLSEAYFVRPIYGTATFKEADDAATSAAERALAVAPDLAEAQLAMAGSLARTSIGPLAAKTYIERALELNPNSVAALGWWAAYQDSQMEERASLRTLLQAVERDPLDAELRRQLVDTYEDLGLEDEAWTSLQKAIELEPDSVANQRLLAQTHVRSGDMVSAVRILRELLAENPEQLQLYMALSRFYAWLGDADTGIAYMRQAYDIRPERVMDDLANIYLDVGDIPNFRKHWADYVEYLKGIGAEQDRIDSADAFVAYVDQDWPRLLTIYDSWLQNDRDGQSPFGVMRVQLQRAGLLHRLGRSEDSHQAMAEAVALAQRAADNGAEYPFIDLVRSYDAAHRGDRAEAARQLERALRFRPINFLYTDLDWHMPPEGFRDWPEVAAVIADFESDQALALAELHAAFPETAP